MQIEHQCPQCGAHVLLEETDRLLTCAFCKTRLFIRARDHLRYCLSPSDPFLEEVIYAPYWRFRGIHYLCKTSGIKEGIIDKTFLAAANEGLPPSLGIRPLSLKMKFLRHTEKARFLKPKISFDRSSAETKKTVTCELVRTAETLFVRTGRDGGYIEVPNERITLKEERIYHEAFVAETVSLVYAPLYVRNDRLYDAITNELLPAQPPRSPTDFETFSGDWQVEFLPTICPNCGWDTLAERDSYVVFCRNCNSAWEARGGDGLNRIDFAVAPSKKVPQTPRSYLPFWCIRADIEGITLRSYADLVRFGNLPKAPKPEWETQPLHLWVPAFKTTPSVLLRVAKQFTIADPRHALEEMPQEPVFPVNLPLREAVETTSMVIADTALRKKELFPLLPDIKLNVREALLVLIPFISTQHEYVQPDINCGFMKNALEWGRNI